MHRTETSNVLVIGTGAAGCRAAIAATQAGVHVLLLGKRALTLPNYSEVAM